MVEPRSPAFEAGYFSAEERILMAHIPAGLGPLLVTLLWSAKECALKAIGVGLREDTRSVVVLNPEITGWSSSGTAAWRPLTVLHASGDFHGWWRSIGALVRTVVASPSPHQPEVLDIAHPVCR